MDDYSEFIAAGYFIAKIADDYRRSDLLPAQLVTVSTCVTETYPDSWAIDWVKDSERAQKAALWGVSETELPRLLEHVTGGFATDMGWPNVFLSLDAAKRFLKAFPPVGLPWKLLGLGVHPRDFEQLLAETNAPDSPPGHAPIGESGVHEAVTKRARLELGGTCLGFDVLGLEPGYTFHSWFCNYLENDDAERFAIRPGRNGLLQDYESARRVAEYARNSGAEPVPWFAYVVVSYSET